MRFIKYDHILLITPPALKFTAFHIRKPLFASSNGVLPVFTAKTYSLNPGLPPKPQKTKIISCGQSLARLCHFFQLWQFLKHPPQSLRNPIHPRASGNGVKVFLAVKVNIGDGVVVTVHNVSFK
jgi:hypothetical protein